MNLFYSLKQSTKALVFCSLIPFGSTYARVVEPMPQLPQISQAEYEKMSPAERQTFEESFKKQVESLNPEQQQAYMEQVVQQMFDSLPPEQQKEVLEEVDRIESMSEEEREKYIKQVEKEMEQAFGRPPAPAKEKPKPVKKPEPEPKPIKKPTPKKPVKIEISKEDQARKESVMLITEVVGSISDFLVKLAVNEEYIIRKTQKWGPKYNMKKWDGGWDWAKLKEKVESLQSKLEKLKERDEKTKKYKYLDFLLEDKDLYNRIYKLSAELADHEPSIKISKKPGKTKSKLDQKIRKRSNKAIRALLREFADLFVSRSKKEKDILTTLDELFKKYEPTAKKITAEEKKKEELALRESKRIGRPTPSRIVGERAERGYAPSSPSYDDLGGFDFGAPGQFEPGYRARRPASPTDRVKPEAPSGKPGDKKVPEKDAKKPTPPKKEKIKKDEDLDKWIGRLENSLLTITEALDEHVELQDLERYLKTQNRKVSLANRHIPSLNRALRRATIHLGRIQNHLKRLKGQQYAAYKKKIKSIIKDQTEELKQFIASLRRIEAQTGFIGSLTPEMQWAHFGVEPPQIDVPGRPGVKEPSPITQTIPEPLPLGDLRKTAETFLDETKNI